MAEKQFIAGVTG